MIFVRKEAYYSGMSTTSSQPRTQATKRPTRTRNKPAGKKASGWVPNQHGAWAMLIAPFTVGAALHVRDFGWSWHILPLFGAWMFGYFAFAAASLWLKSHRKQKFLKPMVTYGSIAGVLGLLVLLLIGPALLWWGVAYVPLTAITLWLVAHRKERSTLSGLLTIAAAGLMAVTAAHPVPTDALRPEAANAWWLAALAFTYFFGTVPYVKTLIRERGHKSWVIGSVVYHVVATALAAVAAALGVLSWWWTAFFALITVRAWLVPALGPMSGRNVSPKHAGFGEVAVTLVFAAIALTTL